MFCDTCVGVLQHRHHLMSVIRSGDPGYDTERGLEYTHGHHFTCDSLVTSASHGCPICQTVWGILSNIEQSSLYAASSSKTRLSTVDTSAPVFITVAVLRRWPLRNSFRLAIRYNDELLPDISKHKYNTFVLEADDNCMFSQSAHLQSEFTSDRTSSTESMQTAAMWLQDCNSSHLSCNTTEGDRTWYPTRLLHLADSVEDESHVRLIRTAQEPPVGPYSTLSHCWGNTMSFQLTQAMESDSNLRFPVVDLPTTFQEAIQVSKRLGIWYLWIDSLCIIQSGDDRQDWYREASLMDMVYTNSHCNISATDAEDSTKGLFRHRAPLYIGRPRVKVSPDGIQPNTEHVECLMTDYLLWPHVLMYSPLDKRGWVFQERYLAPRVLHFGRNQLFWECREHTVCETFPRALPLVSLHYSPPFLKSREQNERRVSSKFDFRERIVDDANETNWETLWTILVRAYSLKKLSVPGDKLVALSGVARHMMSRIKDVYVAGMWRRSLEIMLMWRATGIGPPLSDYRAPSWSWASVDGLIWLDFRVERQSLIHVEDVVLDHATEDSTGAVTGGWLDLRGYLKPMRLRSTSDVQDKGLWPADWHMIFDSSIVSEHRANTTYEELFTCRLDTVHGEESAFDVDNTKGRLFFMPALIEGKSGESSTLWCLLFRLTKFKNKTFERIGVIGTSPDHKQEMLLAELDEEAKAGLPCLRYENGLHTIRII